MRSLETVAIENDVFRMTMISSKSTRVVFSEMVADMDAETREELVTKIRNYSAFNEDNDPYGERDMGRITLDGIDYFFKIDYYDENFEYGIDPREVKPNRILTIMRACEY